VQPIIFHFNCPLCGATPPAKPLMQYLEKWQVCPESDFDALLEQYGGALKEIRCGEARWLTKKVNKWLDRIIKTIPSYDLMCPLFIKTQTELYCQCNCAFCNTPRGERLCNNHFAIWNKACKVQAANLLYEFGIVLFCILRQLPRWATPNQLRTFGDLLMLNQNALSSLGLMECTSCGRWTNCLYGDGTQNNRHRCRWCIDLAGGMRLRLVITDNLTIKAEGIQAKLPSVINGEIMPRTIKPQSRKDNLKNT